jgi:hypothetical protein
MKRACPFDDTMTPMVKSHYSDRDFVVHKGGMESVYAKTLALLFNGANRKKSENNNVAKPSNFNAGTCVSCVKNNSRTDHLVRFQDELLLSHEHNHCL